MKALTLAQPWAAAFPEKDIENRSWCPPKDFLGEVFALHGGAYVKLQSKSKRTLELLGDWEFIRNRYSYPLGPQPVQVEGIFAVTQLVGFWQNQPDGDYQGAKHSSISEKEFQNFFQSSWGFSRVGNCRWFLAETIVLQTPIPCKGALGLWDIPADELEQLNTQLANLQRKSS
jgi:hypothetical protein